MPLTAERNTPTRHARSRAVPVAANAVIYAGAMVALDGLFAVPASTKANLTGLGRAKETVINTGGADGAQMIEVEDGCYLYNNLPADAVTRAEIGKPAYAVDDETVAKTHAANTRSAIGIVYDVSSDGVWVKF